MKKQIGGGQRVPVLFILIFLTAIVLSLVLVQFLPVSGDLKRVIFFVAAPLLAFAGVFLFVKITRRRK